MSETPVTPVARWGKNHWSTFAYLETRVVDAEGRLELERMRCNPRLHRSLAAEISGCVVKAPPTVLRDGSTLDPHDDWSCVEDFILRGLVEMEDEEATKRHRSPRFRLTDLGWKVAHALRRHRAEGGTFLDFTGCKGFFVLAATEKALA